MSELELFGVSWCGRKISVISGIIYHIRKISVISVISGKRSYIISVLSGIIYILHRVGSLSTQQDDVNRFMSDTPRHAMHHSVFF